MPNEPTAPQPFCFVLMPFSAEFNDTYQIGIKEACVAAGAYCERVDEQTYEESILKRIYNQIAKADLLIADMTGKNANVFYEVGYAHALGKSVVLLTKSASDIPFDLKHFPHIIYGESLVVLRDELRKRVEWHIANPPGGDSGGEIKIELYNRGKPIRDGDLLPCKRGRQVKIPLTIHNNSLRTFERGEFKVGVIVSQPFTGSYKPSAVNRATLPDGRTMFTFKDVQTLFPSDVFEFPICLCCNSKNFEEGSTHPLAVRISSAAGIHDFNVKLEAIAG